MKKYFVILKANNIILRARRLKKSYSLYLDIRFNKDRIIENLSIYISTVDKRKYTESDKINLEIAKEIFAQKMIDIANKKYKKDTQEDIDLIEYIDGASEKNFNTVMGLKKHLKNFNKEKKVNIKDVDINYLNDFKNFLIEKVAQKSAYNYFSALSTILKRAEMDNYIEKNPMLKIRNRIKKPDSFREFLLEEELIRLKNTPCEPNNIKTAFLFSCFTGLRLGDIRNLDWKNIRIEDGKYFLYFFQEKVKTYEKMALSGEACNNLIGGPFGNIFNLTSGHHINKTLRQWCRKANIMKKVTFHVARHTFATLLLTYDVDLKTVSKLMGHKEMRTTEIYAKIIDKKKEAAIDKLPVL